MQTAKYSTRPKGKQCNFNVLPNTPLSLAPISISPKYAAWENFFFAFLHYKHEKQRANLLKKTRQEAARNLGRVMHENERHDISTKCIGTEALGDIVSFLIFKNNYLEWNSKIYKCNANIT